MSETDNTAQEQKPKKFKRAIVIVGIVLILIIWGLNWFWQVSHNLYDRMTCGTSLRGLGAELQVYSDENEGQYPIADKWCDVISKYWGARPRRFYCIAEPVEGHSPFAINPNCEPNSPNDVVLLFETKGGWNQSGGPELLNTENHKGKGANILFNDGHVEFVNQEDFGELNWGDE